MVEATNEAIKVAREYNGATRDPARKALVELDGTFGAEVTFTAPANSHTTLVAEKVAELGACIKVCDDGNLVAF